jgi:pimeloyl-ACP methyl ester carboxylesterase
MGDLITSDLNAQAMSIVNAYYLANASKAAYEEDPAAQGQWMHRLGLDRPAMLQSGQPCGSASFIRRMMQAWFPRLAESAVCESGQFFGFLGVLADRFILLAFRGSANPENYLTDAETLLVPRRPYAGLVHRGFAEAVDALWPQIQTALASLPQKLPFWIAGHSLGGAMATLASLRLAEQGLQVKAVYTFGSPRVGNEVFHDAYPLNACNYRFVNYDDIVPHLPLRPEFKHVGTPELLDEDGELAVGQQAWDAKKLVLQATARITQDRINRHLDISEEIVPDWLADHYIDNYIAAIEKNL